MVRLFKLTILTISIRMILSNHKRQKTMLSAEKQKVEKNTLELLKKEEGQRLFVHFLIEGLDQESLAALARRLSRKHKNSKSGMGAKLSGSIGVRKYTSIERNALEITSMLQFFEYRRRLLANSLSVSRVAEMLGTSRQTPHDRVKAGLLLGILDNNALKFPEWQFDPQGPNGIVNGLPEVLDAMQCCTFAKISWLASPNNVFDGLRPIDALKMGKIDEVVHEAASVGVL